MRGHIPNLTFNTVTQGDGVGDDTMSRFLTCRLQGMKEWARDFDLKHTNRCVVLRPLAVHYAVMVSSILTSAVKVFLF